MQAQTNTPKPIPERVAKLRRKALRRFIARKRAFKRPIEEILIELGLDAPVRKCGGLGGAWQ